jgi:hypothetical protein
MSGSMRRRSHGWCLAGAGQAVEARDSSCAATTMPFAAFYRLRKGGHFVLAEWARDWLASADLKGLQHRPES